uniref:Glutathione transferase n=1 Tax=Mucochytrium quahogii TaxID=96639 RepID=A0A7S2RHE0_9STRA|mmetsp:Transcript_20227/g.33394  ORF Transcript_20227/g.33394 Transcript_20227/m.33394 type:complete len:288 (+) Transcript_20227:53-916(+)
MMRRILFSLILSCTPCWVAANADCFSDLQNGDASLTLRYFNIRGLAEPIRLLLAAAGVPYDEVKFENCGDECPSGVEDWVKYKGKHGNSRTLPFGQVPSLTYVSSSGVKIVVVQSLAIQDYIARKCGLLLEDSEEDRARMLIIAGGVMDVRKRYGQLVYNKEVAGEKGSELIDTYVASTLRVWLPMFERLLSESKGPFFMGEKLTYIDTMVFDMLDSNLRIDPQCLGKLPLLHSHTLAVARLLGSYLSSPMRRKFSNGQSAFFDTATHPARFDPEKSVYFLDQKDEL